MYGPAARVINVEMVFYEDERPKNIGEGDTIILDATFGNMMTCRNVDNLSGDLLPSIIEGESVRVDIVPLSLCYKRPFQITLQKFVYVRYCHSDIMEWS